VWESEDKKEADEQEKEKGKGKDKTKEKVAFPCCVSLYAVVHPHGSGTYLDSQGLRW